MSYAKHYTTSVISKSGLTYTLDIWEKDYVGSVEEFEPASTPLVGNYQASSDNPYEPILASTLTVTLDITDFTGTMIDFASTDDRKYHVKLYASGTTYYVWQGFILNESVTVPFTTGRIFLQFFCVDGLALLKYIPYVPSNSNINTLEDLSTTITNCLNKIALPDGYSINYCCGIYATGMSTSASVFKQTYYYPRNWLNRDITYMNCYDILQTICLCFGCQLAQSDGQWWIININERAEDSIRYFTTTQANGSESVATVWKQRTIQPFTSVTGTPFHFQNNTQAKILRKGYNFFEFTCPADFAVNMVDNGNMAELSGGFQRNWSTIGIGGVTLSSLGPFNAINLAPTGGGPTVRTVGCYGDYGSAYIGNTMKLSFILDGQVTISATPKVRLQIFITTPAVVQWYMDSEGNWSTVSTYIDYVGTTTSTYETVSFDSKLIPASGTLRINFISDNFDTLNCTVGNVIVNYECPYDYRDIKNVVTDKTYSDKVEFVMGGASDKFDYSQKGSLLDATGAYLNVWNRYGIGESWYVLNELIGQQYYNVKSIPQVNFSCNIYGLFDSRSSGGLVPKVPHVVGPSDIIKVEDSTGILDVTGKYYMLGSVTMDYANDEMEGTILQVSNVDITTTYTDNLVLKS